MTLRILMSERFQPLGEPLRKPEPEKAPSPIDSFNAGNHRFPDGRVQGLPLAKPMPKHQMVYGCDFGIEPSHTAIASGRFTEAQVEKMTSLSMAAIKRLTTARPATFDPVDKPVFKRGDLVKKTGGDGRVLVVDEIPGDGRVIVAWKDVRDGLQWFEKLSSSELTHTAPSETSSCFARICHEQQERDERRSKPALRAERISLEEMGEAINDCKKRVGVEDMKLCMEIKFGENWTWINHPEQAAMLHELRTMERLPF